MGNFPVAPGSLASLAGTLLAIALYGHPGIHVFLFLLITVAGFAASGRVEKLLGQKDPSCIVIDEVSGVLLAFFTLPLTPAVIVTTFFCSALLICSRSIPSIVSKNFREPLGLWPTIFGRDFIPTSPCSSRCAGRGSFSRIYSGLNVHKQTLAGSRCF